MSATLNRDGASDAAPSRGRPAIEPEQLIIQGSEKKHPLRWHTTPQCQDYLAQELPEVEVPRQDIESLVGVKNAERRISSLAAASANDDLTAGRRSRLEGLLPFLQAIGARIHDDQERLDATKQKTPRLERYPVGRTELAAGQWCSLAIVGDGSVAMLWLLLMIAGAAAEIVVGQFNVTRAELEGMSGGVSWVMAFLPFLGTFAALKWLDPSDIDRHRRGFYKWLVRAALVVTPVSMYLFAAKLDALLEFDIYSATAETGPSFTWVVLFMQMSFAIAIYLASIKLSDAWFHLLGYDVRKTREYLEVCDDLATADDALRSVVEIGNRVQAAVAAIDARAQKAQELFLVKYEQCVKADHERKQKVEAEAAAAAARARLSSFEAT